MDGTDEIERLRQDVKELCNAMSESEVLMAYNEMTSGGLSSAVDYFLANVEDAEYLEDFLHELQKMKGGRQQDGEMSKVREED